MNCITTAGLWRSDAHKGYVRKKSQDFGDSLVNTCSYADNAKSLYVIQRDAKSVPQQGLVVCNQNADKVIGSKN